MVFGLVCLLSLFPQQILFERKANTNTKMKWEISMEQRTLKIVNNCANINIHSYLETSGDQSFNRYLNVVHFFNTSVN
jgi:hypothetical protein